MGQTISGGLYGIIYITFKAKGKPYLWDALDYTRGKYDLIYSQGP